MDYIVIFDVIIFCLGAYVVYSAWQMKRKGEISSFIVNPAEISRCKDKAGFIAFIYGKTMLFGAGVFLFGILAFINDTMQLVGETFNAVGMIAFLVVWFWYNSYIKKGKGKFFY